MFCGCSEYASRIHLYRNRVWTCKVTGKSNLTYEEALVSEQKAIEKVQQFPSELIAPVLRDVQFSMWSSHFVTFIVLCFLWIYLCMRCLLCFLFGVCLFCRNGTYIFVLGVFWKF